MGVVGNHLRRMTSDIERTHDHGTETFNPPSTIVSVVSMTKRWVQVLACIEGHTSAKLINATNSVPCMDE